MTVVVPFKRGGNREWLRTAVDSIPEGVPRLIVENDGELAEALNAGFAQAETPFVFRLDADDALDGGCLDFLHSLIWDVDVTYPSLLYTNADLSPIETRKASAFCGNRLLDFNYVPGTALFRRDKVLEVGGYREMEIVEDWDLHVRLHKAGAKFKGVPEAAYYYRQHAGSRNRRATPEEVEAVNQRARELINPGAPELKATWYYQATFPTTYWRCLLPARFLPGKAVDLPKLRLVGGDSFEYPEQRGAMIWQFPGDTARAVMMSEAQEQGYRVLVECDDSYMDRSPTGNAWGIRLGQAEHTLAAHQKIVPWVDGITVTTEHLAKRYRKFNPNVFVCPNQIDPADWDEPVKDPEVFRIGWFASFSHRDDARLVRRAMEWASEQPGVEVVTMGHNPGWKFRRRHYPWSNDLSVYRKLVGTLDVGVCPVVETPWAACRSDLKALEYAMGLVAPVVSETTPYKPYEGPCLRATSSRDFLNHVKHLVRNRDEARDLARAAREYVLAERTVEKNIWRWEEAISG